MRNLPKVLAIDPDNCGCTECIIGEYIHEDTFKAEANIFDALALYRDEIRNNTSYYSDAELFNNLVDGASDSAVRSLSRTFGSGIILIDEEDSEKFKLEEIDPFQEFITCSEFVKKCSLGDLAYLRDNEIENRSYWSTEALIKLAVSNNENHDLRMIFAAL